MAVDPTDDCAIFLLDSLGHVESWNAAAERITGYNASEIVGNHVSTVYPETSDSDPVSEANDPHVVSETPDPQVVSEADGPHVVSETPDPQVVSEADDPDGVSEAADSHTFSEADDPDVVSKADDPHVGYQPGDPHVDIEQLLVGARAEGSVADEGWLRHKDGSRFWANVVVSALQDDEGTEVSGFVTVTRDVTSPREGTSVSEHYRTVTQTASDVIVRIDTESVIRDVNPAVSEVFGYEPAALVGESIATIIPDRLTDQHFEGVARYLREGDRRLDWEYVEFPGVRSDGTEIPLAISFSEYDYDGETYFTGVIRDITERKERERALEEERASIEQTLDTLQDVFFVYDEETNSLRSNERGRQLTGLSDAEMAEADPMDFFEGADKARLQAAISELRHSGHSTVEVAVVTRAGERIPHEFRLTRLTADDGVVLGFCGIGRDISAHNHRVRQLTGLHQVAQELIQATSAAEVAAVSASAAELVLNLPITGVYEVHESEDDFVTLATTSALRESYDDPTEHLDVQTALEVIEAGEERVRTGRDESSGVPEGSTEADEDRASIQSELILPLGTHGVIQASSTERREFDETDRSLATILAANTAVALERTEREQALTQLHSTTEDILNAETRESVCQHVVDAAYSVLDLSTAGIYLYDEAEGVLRPAATSPDLDDVIGDPPTFAPGEGIAWRVFAEGNDARFRDVREADDVYNPDTPIQSELVLSLGDHGVFMAGSRKAGVFDDATVELAELLAGTAEAALERSRREQLVKEHERELEIKTTQLSRLNRLNELIRDVNHALVRAETRQEIETSICERLVERGISLAWIAKTDQSNDRLEPTAWAGTEGGYIDRIPVTDGEAESLEPTFVAARTGTVTVADPVSRNVRTESWRRVALEHRFQSVASIPLVYDGHFFGVLSAYTKEPAVFDAIPPTVLRELGETIGYAINVAERQQLLLGNTTVELEFEVGDTDCVPLQLARQSGCELSVTSVLPQSDKGALAFVTVRDGDPAAVLALDDQSVLVEKTRLIGDDESQDVELVLTRRPLEVELISHGARLKETTVDDRVATFLIEARNENAQGVLEYVTEAFDDVELLARREREFTDREGSVSPGSLELTERQREVMEAAYHAGYFDWPRGSTAEELADSLGVSSATVHHHLREVQRKLVSRSLDSGISKRDR